ncbi:MAG: hypothetical protein R2795_20640 [Saprospiraceae bacterium]
MPTNIADALLDTVLWTFTSGTMTLLVSYNGWLRLWRIRVTQVTVVDVNGCSATASITLAVMLPVGKFISPTVNFCQ